MSSVASTIANGFYGDGFDLSERKMGRASWSRMPEVRAVRDLKGSGQSDLTIRRFLTFVSAMDRTRNSMRLWHDATRMLKELPTVVVPAVVSTMPPQRLRETLATARVSQRHNQDTNAWKTIACSLLSLDGAVAQVVEHGTGDAIKMLKDLMSTSTDKLPRYPLLRGPKIGPMWVRIMAEPGGAKVENMDFVPVAVDTHVRKVTENLHVAKTAGLHDETAKAIIQCAWHNAVRKANFGGPSGIAGTCAAVDPAVWYLGKYGCSHCQKVRRRVPIGKACESCQYGADQTNSS